MATRNSTSEEICIIHVATVNALSGSECMGVHDDGRNDEGGSTSRNPLRYGVCTDAPPVVAIIGYNAVKNASDVKIMTTLIIGR
jgi:hypothetical protein